MKNILIHSLAIVTLSTSALAYSPDIYGGPQGAQTVHNCAGVGMTAQRYTTSPTTIHIVKQKLASLGYVSDMASDKISKRDLKTIKRFQSAQGLKADGVVGPQTALALAFETAPNRNVARCLRMAMQ